MPIFHKNKTIFVRIPKTASTSMHMALGRNAHDGMYHETISSIKDRVNPSIFNSYFKFAFVRNPWDWALSWFYFKKTKIWKGESGPDFSTWIENIGKIAESRGGLYWFPGVEYSPLKKSLKSCGWSTCRAKIGYPCLCLMTNKQSDFICNSNGDIQLDFVGRFESLKEDWRHVVSKVKGPAPEDNLGHFVKTNHKSYREEYSKKAEAVVRSLYKDDIRLFDYDF